MSSNSTAIWSTNLTPTPQPSSTLQPITIFTDTTQPGFQWQSIVDQKGQCQKFRVIDEAMIREEKCPGGGIRWQPLQSQPDQCQKYDNPSGVFLDQEQCPKVFAVIPKESVAHDLQGGAVAGIAVGMFVAGLLLAGAISLFLLRRQKKRQVLLHHTEHVASNQYPLSATKGPTIVTSSVLNSLDDLLPQPVADDTITAELSKIRDNMKNHVRTYYHAAQVSLAQIDEKAIESLALATGISASVLASALANPKQRPVMIRLVLAWVILPRITGEKFSCFLPSDVAGLIASLPGKSGSSACESPKNSILFPITATYAYSQLKRHYSANGKRSQERCSSSALARICRMLSALRPSQMFLENWIRFLHHLCKKLRMVISAVRTCT